MNGKLLDTIFFVCGRVFRVVIVSFTLRQPTKWSAEENGVFQSPSTRVPNLREELFVVFSPTVARVEVVVKPLDYTLAAKLSDVRADPGLGG